MKKAVTIGLAAFALALPLTYVVAGSRTPEPLAVAPADTMPAYELFTRLRMLELEPQGEPLRRGPYYVLHAVDARGRTLRVVADAELGDILSITPARAPLWRPQGAPRIIHIPDPAEMQDARVTDDSSEEVPADVDAPRPRSLTDRPVRHVRPLERKADLPPQRRTPRDAGNPKREPQALAPESPPPVERRNILTAPPPPPQAVAPRDPLTPVYPTPRFGGPDDKAAAASQSPSAPAKAESMPADATDSGGSQPNTAEPVAAPTAPDAAAQQ